MNVASRAVYKPHNRSTWNTPENTKKTHVDYLSKGPRECKSSHLNDIFRLIWKPMLTEFRNGRLGLNNRFNCLTHNRRNGVFMMMNDVHVEVCASCVNKPITRLETNVVKSQSQHKRSLVKRSNNSSMRSQRSWTVTSKLASDGPTNTSKTIVHRIITMQFLFSAANFFSPIAKSSNATDMVEGTLEKSTATEYCSPLSRRKALVQRKHACRKYAHVYFRTQI